MTRLSYATRNLSRKDNNHCQCATKREKEPENLDKVDVLPVLNFSRLQRSSYLHHNELMLQPKLAIYQNLGHTQ